MMKPKAEDKNDTGLLEYLEDIIGTHQYVAPIEEQGKRLEVRWAYYAPTCLSITCAIPCPRWMPLVCVKAKRHTAAATCCVPTSQR